MAKGFVKLKIPAWASAIGTYGLAQSALAASAYIKIPLIVQSVGPKGYGVVTLVVAAWTVISALCDGMSQLARVMVAESRTDVRRVAVSRQLFRIGILEALVVLVGGCMLLMGWRQGAPGTEVVPWLAIGVGSALVLPFAHAKGMLEGRERVSLSNAGVMGNVLVSLPAVYLASRVESLGLMCLATVLGLASPFLLYAWVERETLFKSVLGARLRVRGAQVYSRGVWAMTIWSFANVLAYAFDPFIIGAVLGLEATAEFGLGSRIMTLAMMFPLGLSGLVSARVTFWRASLDVVELRRRVLRLSMMLSIAGFGISAVALALAPYIGSLLTGGTIVVPMNLYFILAAYAWLSASTTAVFALFAGPRVARVRGYLGAASGILNVALSVFLVRVMGIGGPPLASLICLLGMVVYLLVYWVRWPERVSATHIIEAG